jgi:polysaccharide biosynthesis transport protein
MGQQSATRTDQEISDNPVAQQLRGDLVGLEVSLTSELALHTDKYPSVVALKAKIEAVKNRLNEELSKTISKERTEFNPVYDALVQNRINLETERVALLAEGEALQRVLRQLRSELPGLDHLQLDQSRLNRNVEIAAREYGDLQNRLDQARLKEQEVQDLGSLAVESPAGIGHPVSPWGKFARLAFAAVLGLTGGAAVAFSFEYLDSSIKTPENAERLLGMPVLASVPRHNPPFDEAYRLLRVNVAARAHKHEPDVIAIMSPKPREGTSTVVANLASAFAKTGRHVIVVDAALHRPTQHIHFRVSNQRGLVNILAGDAALDEALTNTYIPNLWVLPAGSVPAEGTLDGGKMSELVAELKQKADLVLVDTPAGVFSDAFAVVAFASAVLVVLDARQSPRGVEDHVKTQLDRLGANVLGVVLTKVRQDLVPAYTYQDAEERPHRKLPAAATMMVIVAMIGLGIAAGLYLNVPQNRDLAFGLMRAVVHWTSLRVFGTSL